MSKLRAIFVSLVLASAALWGCGKNACEEACDKMKECGVTGSTTSCSGDCPADSEKMAKCISALSCEDMKDMTKLAQCAGSN
jgi:hypothetical protein